MRQSRWFLILFIFLCFSTAAWTEFLPENQNWKGGIGLSSEGFLNEEGHRDVEYANVSLFFSPWERETLNPSFYLDFLIPVVPMNPEGAFLGFRGDLELFRLFRPRVLWFFRQDIWYTPALSIGYYIPFTQQEVPFVNVTLYTLRLHTETYKTSYLSPYLNFHQTEFFGFGVKIFEISLYFF